MNAELSGPARAGTNDLLPVAPVFDGVAPLPWSTVFELMRFQHDNTPVGLRLDEAAPRADVPVEISADGLRQAVRFTASCARGDLSVPRHLEAYRVLRLVPDEYGAALFGVPLP